MKLAVKITLKSRNSRLSSEKWATINNVVNQFLPIRGEFLLLSNFNNVFLEKKRKLKN